MGHVAHEIPYFYFPTRISEILLAVYMAEEVCKTLLWILVTIPLLISGKITEHSVNELAVQQSMKMRIFCNTQFDDFYLG